MQATFRTAEREKKQTEEIAWKLQEQWGCASTALLTTDPSQQLPRSPVI